MDRRAMLFVARDLLERPDPHTAGIWPRASALLARQALEAALDDLWRRRAPGLERCSMRAQLLCLPAYLPADVDLATRASFAWMGLSRGSHHHAYELPPAAVELSTWIEVVEQLAGRLERT